MTKNLNWIGTKTTNYIFLCSQYIQQLHARAFLAFHFSFLYFSMSSFIFHIMGITLFSEKFRIEKAKADEVYV